MATPYSAALYAPGMEKWTVRECAEHCGVRESTWRSYVSRNGAPKPLPDYDRTTGLRHWDAAEVRAWHASRSGPGWRKGSRSR